MASINDSERLDVLLALALAFNTGETAEARSSSSAALASLSALPSTDMKALERRAKWHARLAPDEGARWLARTLSRAHQSTRERLARIDEYVHPSHFIEALRAEPAPVQSLVLRHLPPVSIEFVAEALGVPPPTNERDDDDAADDYYPRDQRGHHHHGNINHDASQTTPKHGADAITDSLITDSPSTRPSIETPAKSAPQPDVVDVVRREFLSRFVAADSLRAPKNLDLLSGAQLARIVRLLGVRETAIACRGEAARESVAAFLRRFSPEDARSIAAHINALTHIEPARVLLSERLVHSAMSAENTPEAMLDQIGMSVLAFSLAERDDASRRYTAQKLPVEAAKELAAIVEDSNAASAAERKTIRHFLDETETLAANLRRPRANDGVASTTATRP